jgi:phosphonopyruvate decarboxylase
MKAIQLIKEFKIHRLGPYIEVPCSILDPVIEAISQDRDCEIINPANEAIAMGIAAGSFLASRRIPVVLTQNSGLCNTLNALTSLNQIYKIPVLYLVSWRGEPGVKDAPEHHIMGLKLRKILKTFDVPFEVLSARSYKIQIASIIDKIITSKKPAAILLRKGVIEQNVHKDKMKVKKVNCKVSRAKAVNLIIRETLGRAVYVTTNGYISREAFHILSRMGKDNKEKFSFYMLGSMGHALALGLGIERNLKNRKVIVLDGDGGCLMHLGAMASISNNTQGGRNIIHVVLDNGVYASTGGQPSISRNIDFTKIGHGCGYKSVHSIKNIYTLKKMLPHLLNFKTPAFIHIWIDNVGLPKPRVSERYSCEQIKESFVNLITQI